ncbi:Rossmann-fold NAD(P)-binding domain-containing protein [Marinomonas communis]|uniref:epimerase n=1 Tax=Marinomonas communis TaxID=28254 RepID=UPI001D192419|nr:epimerase [Marinomonas communis]MCC4274347.1 epimerase [Marinomonas communis]
MTQVLIAGCGDLGQGVAQYFVKKQAQVTGIRRSGTVFPDGVRGMTHDLLTLPAEQWPDVDLLYLIMTPQGRTAEAYHTAYVMTAAAVVAAYQGRRQPKVIFVSSTSVYGQNNGEWVDDQTQAVAASETASKLLEAENLLLSNLSTVALRCSGIYGPGRYRLLQGVQRKDAWGANQWTNRIHRDDVVSALCLLGERALAAESLPSHIIVSDGQPTSMWEVKLWLAERLQVSTPLGETINRADYLPARGKRIVPHALRALGWAPQYPSYVAGYESMMAAYHEWLD